MRQRTSGVRTRNLIGCTAILLQCLAGLALAQVGNESAHQSISKDRLASAIDQSARYLAGLCDENGRFVYRQHLDPDVTLSPAYNELRHAGAIYALAQYCQRSPDAGVSNAMLRATRYMRLQCLRPLPDNSNLLALWAPKTVQQGSLTEAKLGGAGLALVALLSVERLQPGTVPKAELLGLGRFMVFMQRGDGSFSSKFFPGRGRSNGWQSDYYPGEAALGLLMLHQFDANPQWSQAAAKALHYLAEQGTTQRPTFPDQWFLLAADQYWDLPPDDARPASRDEVAAHAQHICVDMLNAQDQWMSNAMIAGCFTSDGRSCPTATRLEGLLAARDYLPANDVALRERLHQGVERGMEFLLRCQITNGPHAGAFPRVLPAMFASREEPAGEFAGEIRIDYVQHALSAMIAYELLLTATHD
jgi:hypothetical protein